MKKEKKIKRELKRFYCQNCNTEYVIAFGYKKFGEPIFCDNCRKYGVIDRWWDYKNNTFKKENSEIFSLKT